MFGSLLFICSGLICVCRFGWDGIGLVFVRRITSWFLRWKLSCIIYGRCSIEIKKIIR